MGVISSKKQLSSLNIIYEHFTAGQRLARYYSTFNGTTAPLHRATAKSGLGWTISIKH